MLAAYELIEAIPVKLHLISPAPADFLSRSSMVEINSICQIPERSFYFAALRVLLQ